MNLLLLALCASSALAATIPSPSPVLVPLETHPSPGATINDITVPGAPIEDESTIPSIPSPATPLSPSSAPLQPEGGIYLIPLADCENALLASSSSPEDINDQVAFWNNIRSLCERHKALVGKNPAHLAVPTPGRRYRDAGPPTPSPTPEEQKGDDGKPIRTPKLSPPSPQQPESVGKINLVPKPKKVQLKEGGEERVKDAVEAGEEAVKVAEHQNGKRCDCGCKRPKPKGKPGVRSGAAATTSANQGRAEKGGLVKRADNKKHKPGCNCGHCQGGRGKGGNVGGQPGQQAGRRPLADHVNQSGRKGGLPMGRGNGGGCPKGKCCGCNGAH